MTNPDISVIIPTSRNAADLEFCLGALLKQNAVNFEVIIVTKSGEGYDCLKEKFSGLNLIFINEKERKGLSAARNLGLLSAKGDIVSYIDDDVLVGKDWLKEVMATFQKSTNIGGVTGPTIIPSDSLGNRDILAFHNKIEKNIFWKIIGKLYTAFVLENKPYCIGKIFKSGGFSLGSNYIDATKMNKDLEVDYLEACNMSFKKKVLDKIGGFALEYAGVGDWSEPDLAFRVKEENYRLIFNPKAIVNHMVSKHRVYGEKGGDSYQRAKNFVHFYFKWIGPDTLEKTLRFSFNLLFINLYWIYKFFQTRNINWLLGVKGTLSSLRSELCKW